MSGEISRLCQDEAVEAAQSPESCRSIVTQVRLHGFIAFIANNERDIAHYKKANLTVFAWYPVRFAVCC